MAIETGISPLALLETAEREPDLFDCILDALTRNKRSSARTDRIAALQSRMGGGRRK